MHLISVVMSTYNETGKHLKDSVDSILNQSYKNFEYIIILDNPDNVEIRNILESYEIKDSRIKLLYNEKNMGLVHSLNKGIKFSKGNFIARMDADDISFDNRLEEEIKYMIEQELDMVSTAKTIVDEEGVISSYKESLPVKEKKIIKELKKYNLINHPSVIIRKSVFDKIGLYRELPASEDYDMWLRMVTSNLKIGIINEAMIYYRVRKDSITSIATSDHYKKFLLYKYHNKLFQEREKNGSDNFSIENLENFLIENNYYEDRARQEFNSNYKILDKIFKNVRENNYLLGFKNGFTLISKDKRFVKIIWRIIEKKVNNKIYK